MVTRVPWHCTILNKRENEEGGRTRGEISAMVVAETEAVEHHAEGRACHEGTGPHRRKLKVDAEDAQRSSRHGYGECVVDERPKQILVNHRHRTT